MIMSDTSVSDVETRRDQDLLCRTFRMGRVLNNIFLSHPFAEDREGCGRDERVSRER
jgi:hypothetical protein